jgi:Acetyltransferase (GNAT) domain
MPRCGRTVGSPNSLAASQGRGRLLGPNLRKVPDSGSCSAMAIGGFAQQDRGIPDLVGYPECGWTFVPDVWGRGIASEAVAAMVNWSDSALGAETRCLINRGNAPSIKVATRNGYVCFSDNATDPALFKRQVPLLANPA